MSSPKAAAAKTARRPRAAAAPTAKSAPKPVAKPAAKPASPVANGASAEATRLAAEIERAVAEGRLDVLSTEALQALMAAVCRAYAARTEAGDQSMPLRRNALSATDIMVSASGLLRAADLAVFELGMWQSWTGR
jgi:hypothetical protein